MNTENNTKTLPVLKLERKNSGIESRFILYGYSLVQVHTPSHAITPYDYHGMRWCIAEKTKAAEEGREIIIMEEKREALNPIGSGRGGSVRFGDSMMPSTYYVYEKRKD